MILTFRNQGAEDVFDGKSSKAARKTCPPDLQRRARAKLFLLDDAEDVTDLRIPPSNHLEALKGDRSDSTVSGSTSNTGSVSDGQRAASKTLRSLTTIPSWGFDEE